MSSVRGKRTFSMRVGAAVAVALALGAAGFAARSGTPGPGAPDAAAEVVAEPGSLEPERPLAAEDAAAPEETDAGAVPPDEDGAAAVAGAMQTGDAVAIPWAEPTERSPVVPVPAEQRVPKPEAVRGIYVGAWSVGSASRLDRLIRLADETEVNAFVIDIKDVTGEVTHATRVPLAVQLGADRRIKIPDLRGVLERLREHGIYPIARIVVFKDPLLATGRPEWSIEREDGTLWADNNDVHWVDSYNRAVWDYNIELAREAIALGFSEIQWDYVRFPDVPSSYMVEAVYPAQAGRSKTDGIREFMLYARDRLADLGAPLTADVFGITTSTHRDIGIGQVWEKMADAVDVLLPMVYPSHYPDGSWGYENPNGAPYQIVKRAMEDGVERNRLIEEPAGIRPWLQAFTLGEPAYDARYIRAQIDAVYDAGLTEWILWHPAVRYPAETFAGADGTEPWFAGMGASLYEPPAAPADSLAATADNGGG